MCFWFFKKKKNVESKVEEKEESVKAPEKGNNESKTEEKNTTVETVKEAKKAKTEEAKERKAPTKKVYHVSLRKEDGKWQVKYGGGKKAIKLFDTQAEAIKFAEQRADSQDGSISIHKKDGKIRKQDYSKKD
jgi:hypothetical protein